MSFHVYIKLTCHWHFYFELVINRQKVHNESRMSSKIVCEVCGTEHESSNALWKHKLKHFGPKIKCSVSETCTYTSVYIADVRVHETRCGRDADSKDWECECGSQFTMKQNWQKHHRKNRDHKLTREHSLRRVTENFNFFADTRIP